MKRGRHRATRFTLSVYDLILDAQRIHLKEMAEKLREPCRGDVSQT